METFEERQKRENQKFREKYISCGFSDDEIKLNEHGWLIPVLRLHYPVETITVFDKKGYRASIEFCQLPNKKWVAASDLTCPLHGFGSACSVWDPQYETKEEAVTKEIDRIEKALEAKDRKPYVMQGIQTCRQNFKKAPLFEPIKKESFEQISLF